jgi:hypothetical protein
MGDLGTYPTAAGWKGRDTSEAAAQHIEASGRAPTLRERARDLFKAGRRMTADEAAAALHESILSVRPRISELARLGVIRDTGERRLNSSGVRAVVWALALPKGQAELPL